MSDELHLEKIVAKCRANLALAAKRTQGKWDLPDWQRPDFEPTRAGGTIVIGRRREIHDITCADAAFISACAGAAEAGWRATIAAVEGCREIVKWKYENSQYAEAALSAIIAAWPEELL